MIYCIYKRFKWTHFIFNAKVMTEDATILYDYISLNKSMTETEINSTTQKELKPAICLHTCTILYLVLSCLLYIFYDRQVKNKMHFPFYITSCSLQLNYEYI